MRPIRTHVSVLAILLVALLALVGCTMVGDRLTGVEVQSHRPNECVRACNEEFVADMTAETRRLAAALEECRPLPPADKKTCHEAALAAFHAAVTALGQERKTCVNNCHRQGSGFGG